MSKPLSTRIGSTYTIKAPKDSISLEMKIHLDGNTIRMQLNDGKEKYVRWITLATGYGPHSIVETLDSVLSQYDINIEKLERYENSINVLNIEGKAYALKGSAFEKEFKEYKKVI